MEKFQKVLDRKLDRPKDFYDPLLDPASENRLDTMVGAGPRSGKWPKVRDAHLVKFPTCAACGSKTALEVHHKVPFHVAPEKELDPDNLITLCECPSHNCHFIFGHLLNWKNYNPDVEGMTCAYLIVLKKSRERNDTKMETDNRSGDSSHDRPSDPI